MTPTWFEHATFWSGVRRATVAPRSHLHLSSHIVLLKHTNTKATNNLQRHAFSYIFVRTTIFNKAYNKIISKMRNHNIRHRYNKIYCHLSRFAIRFTRCRFKCQASHRCSWLQQLSSSLTIINTWTVSRQLQWLYTYRLHAASASPWVGWQPWHHTPSLCVREQCVLRSGIWASCSPERSPRTFPLATTA